MNEAQARALIARIAEMHADHGVWYCGASVFRFTPDGWTVDSRPLADMDWSELLATAALIADCAWT